MQWLISHRLPCRGSRPQWWQVEKVNPIKLYEENKVIAGFSLLNLLFKQGRSGLVKTVVQKLFSLYEQKKIKPVVDSLWAVEEVSVVGLQDGRGFTEALSLMFKLPSNLGGRWLYVCEWTCRVGWLCSSECWLGPRGQSVCSISQIPFWNVHKMRGWLLVLLAGLTCLWWSVFLFFVRLTAFQRRRRSLGIRLYLSYTGRVLLLVVGHHLWAECVWDHAEGPVRAVSHSVNQPWCTVSWVLKEMAVCRYLPISQTAENSTVCIYAVVYYGEK